MIRIVLSCLLTVAWLASMPYVPSTITFLLCAASFAAFIAMLRRADGCSPFAMALAGGASLLVAVALEPRGSHDIWSYIAYGREIAVHHANPYLTAPNAFPTDPLLSHVAMGWRHVETVYGPLFSACSAAGAALAGNSVLGNRLMHQVLEATAVAAAGPLLARPGRRTRAAAFLTCNPAMLAIVNGGHNDALTGVLVAAGAVVAGRGKALWSTLLLAAAISVKIIAALPALVVLVWLAHRNRLRAAWTFIGITALTMLSYALVGGWAALRPVVEGTGTTSRASVWALPHHILPFTLVSLLAVGGVLLVLWRTRQRWGNRSAPTEGAETALLSTTYLSPYVLPWYSGWSLPAAALVDERVGAAAIGMSAAMQLAYANPPGTPSNGLLGAISMLALPLAGAVTLLKFRLRARR